MTYLRKSKVLHKWNKVRGIPIEWDLSPYEKILRQITRKDLGNISDVDLQASAKQLRERASRGESQEELLVEAFALVREASKRTLGLWPFDVQVIAGIALHRAKLVEMNTGEGKTLAAVFPAYLNALTGGGVHIFTFNDYLARRDAAWMGPIYAYLGLSTGCIQDGMPPPERKKAYEADITYSTAKEAGFDILRDQLCYAKNDLVHRDLNYVIVDEADSLLIDEARVPLVIAGSSERPHADPGNLSQMVKNFKDGVDFKTDEGKRNIFLTDSGHSRIEALLSCGSLHAPENLDLLTQVNQALHAEFLLQRDVDYIVRSGKVEIVDEFTGRVVEDRHWPDGLQAAVEAKEKIRMGTGGSILGSITLQHFLALYRKISGMTATAQPAADELHRFYGLKVVVIPPHRACIRTDYPDMIFTHKEAKYHALTAEISRCYAQERPVLVGTASVEESEQLATQLRDAGISCQVLNAKNDALEAEIIAQAGRPGAVTISTNMAGRGTDIKLGGDKEQERERVVNMGGLYVIGTNRHESLRIDSQLRGRAGRQGDPGSSRFFVSFEDNLIERFGIRNLFPKKYRTLRQAGPIESPVVSRELLRGQRIIEGQNFEIRKTLWNYSMLAENHRRQIQDLRREILVEDLFGSYLQESSPLRFDQLKKRVGLERSLEVEKKITLFAIDRCWAQHLAHIADVREGIHLTGVGGESPLRQFVKIIDRQFQQLEQKIYAQILRTFDALPLTDDGVDLDKEGIRGPSSTWTYLVSDDQFGLWAGLLQGSNIGFTAGAAAAYGPLYILMAVVQRRFGKKPN